MNERTNGGANKQTKSHFIPTFYPQFAKRTSRILFLFGTNQPNSGGKRNGRQFSRRIYKPQQPQQNQLQQQ